MTGTTQDDYTDRYARRVRGMTTSEIRALFSVASRPEVVSLAGGSRAVAVAIEVPHGPVVDVLLDVTGANPRAQLAGQAGAPA